MNFMPFNVFKIKHKGIKMRFNGIKTSVTEKSSKDANQATMSLKMNAIRSIRICQYDATNDFVTKKTTTKTYENNNEDLYLSTGG